MAHLNSAERDTLRKKRLAAVVAHWTHVMHLAGCFYLLTVTFVVVDSTMRIERMMQGSKRLWRQPERQQILLLEKLGSQQIARLKLSAKRLLNNG